MDIVALLQCLQPAVTKTTRRQCSRIVLAMLVMTGRVTMLGLSRGPGQGAVIGRCNAFSPRSSRGPPCSGCSFVSMCTVPRMSTSWSAMNLATKAGKQTHGLDRSFSSLYGKPVPGLAFFALSLVSTQQRRSFPTASSRSCATTRRKQPARPKRQPRRQQSAVRTVVLGVQRAARTHPKPTDPSRRSYCVLQAWLDALLHLIAGVVPLTSLVLDGHFGNHNALQMARQHNLHLISKLRYDAALYFPYTGPYAGRGPIASMATRSITTTSQCHTSKRPRSRGT